MDLVGSVAHDHTYKIRIMSINKPIDSAACV